MKHRLIEKLTNQPDQVSDFETIEELLAHKALRQEASPESSFEEEDKTAEVEAKREKEKKKKEFQFKGATIAALRQELNEWLAL